MVAPQVKNLEPVQRVRYAAGGAASGTGVAVGLAGITEWLGWSTPPTVIALVAGVLGWLGASIAANGVLGLWRRLLYGQAH